MKPVKGILISFPVGILIGYFLATQLITPIQHVTYDATHNRDHTATYLFPSTLDNATSKLHIEAAANGSPKQRKIFLDCGGNAASSVSLFRELYPEAREYEYHTFEMDEKLGPFFAPYVSQGIITAHIPVAVGAKEGSLTAYIEGPWFPGKLNSKKEMQWGGGSLFAFDSEKKEDGGRRAYTRHVTVPIIDLSQWIQQNTKKEDYVILKLDVEGAEYEILRKMLADKTFDWIDKFYGEYHTWIPTGLSKAEKELITSKTNERYKVISWAGERKSIADIEELQKPMVPDNTPGSLDVINSNCQSKSHISIVIEIGMNAEKARILVETLKAHDGQFSLTLFVYGDFILQNPALVLQWSQHSEIGIRGSSPLPNGLWQLQNKDSIRLSIISAEVRLRELGLIGMYLFPPGFGTDVINTAKTRQLRLIDSVITFPPRKDGVLTFDSYFKRRDVERTPKALALIHSALDGKGGILSLDSDFPDSYLISAFLLDYIFEKSDFKVVTLRECLSS